METRTTKINDSSHFLQGATTLTVDDTTGFEDNGYLRIENELIHYTGKTAASFTGITRGAGGTTDVQHNNDVAIFQDLSVTDDWVDEKDPALQNCL